MVFNVGLALAFLLSVGKAFSKLLTRLLPDPPQAANPATPLYLDQAALSSRHRGAVQCLRVRRCALADMVVQMLQRLPDVLFQGNRNSAPSIVANGRSVDLLGRLHPFVSGRHRR